MQSRQTRNMESNVRVEAFVAAHPVPEPLSYGGDPAALSESIRRQREYAGAEEYGRDLSRGELRRQEQLITKLKAQHMRPIVAIARTQIEPEADARLASALRMPRGSTGPTRMLQKSDTMIEAAKQFESVFIAHGRPADFLARFTAARDALAQTLGGRAVLVGTHVGARKGIEVELRRSRRAVDRIDAVVRDAFANDEVVLARWRAAKRIHRLPAGAVAQAAIEMAVAA